jgi:hypothetical protein
MTDAESGLGNEPAADLDSILSTAIETHTPKEDAPIAEAAPVEAAAEPVADDAGRLRGPDGKFVAKPDSAEPVASQEPTADPAKPAAITAPEPAQQPLEAPTRWTADKKAQFAAWPRDVQETVLERIKEQEADYTRKTQETAELRRSAEPILNAIAPYQQYLNQVAPRIGQTPDKMIANLIGVEYQLRTGDPYEKVTALHQIAQSYGIDLAAMSRGEMPAGPDPAYTQLRQSFGTLEQQVAQLRQEREQEQQRQTVQQIESFSTAADESGRPKHPHFERVRGVMGQLMGDDPTLTLEQAYQKAVEPINEAIAQELKTRQEAAEKQRLETLEKAKKAAPVKSTGSQPNGSAKSKDLDSILSDAIDSRMSA